MNSNMADDLLQGIEAISRFTGIKPRRLYYLAESGLLPGVFKLGGRWCARRSTLTKVIGRLEGEAA